MGTWENFEFKVVRQKDVALMRALEAAFEASEVACSGGSAKVLTGPDIAFADFNDAKNNSVLKETLDKGAVLLSNVIISFGSTPPFLKLVVTRDNNSIRDTVHFDLSQTKQKRSLIGDQELVGLISNVKSALKEITAFEELEYLGGVSRQHYETREAELAKLASLSERILHETHVRASELEGELRKQRQEWLEQDAKALNERKEILEEEFKARQGELQLRESEVQKRLQAIDATDARSARRRLRSDIKEELKQREGEFHLTAGTRGLRWPIRGFCYILLAVEVLLVLILGNTTASQLAHLLEIATKTDISQVLWVDFTILVIRQFVALVAFGATSVFYIRWENRWFEQHAAEEFRQKRLELDLDRASWVVETTMEWENERQSPIPPELIERLTRGLFVGIEQSSPNLHPADQLASALLGSSAEAVVQLPGGSSFKFDRKGIDRLSKASKVEVPSEMI